MTLTPLVGQTIEGQQGHASGQWEQELAIYLPRRGTPYQVLCKGVVKAGQRCPLSEKFTYALVRKKGTFLDHAHRRKKMLTLFYSPHMTSVDNETGHASGHADVPLSALGRKLAQDLGKHY